jgi:ParB family transcriptional regulator, chromosome partitioning protein
MSNNKKRALGRGLASILESPDTDITSKDISGNYVVGAIANINIEKIGANPFQPRTAFDRASLEELSISITEQGIIQPITVRKLGYDKYQLISGERRLKACKLAGLDEIPCYIRVANDEQMLEMALVENIHREDLNSIEIAISYQRLIDECKLTHEKLSERLGKNRTTITNYLRLLKLSAEVQIALRDTKISMGHARALINLPDNEAQIDVLDQIIEDGLSVREVERLVKEYGTPVPGKKKTVAVQLPEKFKEAKKMLHLRYDAKVGLDRNNKGKGKIVISFDSDEDFDRIFEKLK